MFKIRRLASVFNGYFHIWGLRTKVVAIRNSRSKEIPVMYNEVEVIGGEAHVVTQGFTA